MIRRRASRFSLPTISSNLAAPAVSPATTQAPLAKLLSWQTGGYIEPVEHTFKTPKWREERWLENLEQENLFPLHAHHMPEECEPLERPAKTRFDKDGPKEPLFHDVYITSEDDISPTDSTDSPLAPWAEELDESLFDDDDLASVSSSENSDVAYTVSIFSVGRPRVVDVSPRGSIRCQRSSSLHSRSGSSSFSIPSLSRGDSGDWIRASYPTHSERIESHNTTTIDEESAMDAERFYSVFGSDNNLNLDISTLKTASQSRPLSRISAECVQPLQHRLSYSNDSHRLSRLSVDSGTSRLKRQHRMSSIWHKS